MVDIKNSHQNFLLEINGYNLSEYVSSYKINEYDIQSADTGRDESGNVHYERIKKDEPKISISWSKCPSSFKNQIKKATTAGVFNVTFVDDDGGKENATTYKFYRGDRAFEMKRDIHDEIIWNCECSFTGM